MRNVIDYYLERSAYPLKIDGKDYSKEDLKDWHFRIVSKNNFPTAAGLASSSSGIACLGKFNIVRWTYFIVLCLRDIFNFKESYEGQISEIAR